MTPQAVRDEPVAPDERNEPQTREQLIVALRVLAQDTEDDDEMLVTVKEDTYVWLAADMLRADAGKDATIERLTAEAHEWRRATQAGIDMATARGEELVKLHDQLAARDVELAELRKDAERLNFLDRVNANVNAHYGTRYGWKFDVNCNRACLAPPSHNISLTDHNIPALSVRDALDAAIAAAAKPVDEGEK